MSNRVLGLLSLVVLVVLFAMASRAFGADTPGAEIVPLPTPKVSNAKDVEKLTKEYSITAQGEDLKAVNKLLTAIKADIDNATMPGNAKATNAEKSKAFDSLASAAKIGYNVSSKEVSFTNLADNKMSIAYDMNLMAAKLKQNEDLSKAYGSLVHANPGKDGASGDLNKSATSKG